MYYGLFGINPILAIEIVAHLDLGVIFKVKVKNRKMKKIIFENTDSLALE